MNLTNAPAMHSIVTEPQKQELREICSWWEGRTLIERGYSLMSPLNKEIHDSGIIRAEGNLTSGDAHIAVNFEKILKHRTCRLS